MDYIQQYPLFPSFRVIDLEGEPISDKHKQSDPKLLNLIFQKMIMLDETDRILYSAQRQGKISFYMTSFGETAAVIGSAAGVQDHDLIFPQYREQGALVWRGFTVEDMINNCMGNMNDNGKGRQMPIHYGSSKLNFMTVSSPLTTQVPQAAGAGYSFRLQNEDRVAVTYFGEGAASEGDFHSALNFAATLKAQTLFICRNNKYAISTSIEDQYAGDGIAVRGPAYGIATMRVDGNDCLAVLQATQFARNYIMKEKKPFLLEFMTYRVGDHSTSDHSVLYRSEEELKSWQEKNNPIIRLKKYLQKQNLIQFSEEKIEQMKAQFRQECIDSLRKCAETKYLPWQTMFDDVYDNLTENLVEQKNQLSNHIKKHSEKYDNKKFT